MAPTVALPHAAMLDCAITAEALQHGAKQQLMTFTASLLKYISYTVATVQKHTTKVLYVNFILKSSQARSCAKKNEFPKQDNGGFPGPSVFMVFTSSDLQSF